MTDAQADLLVRWALGMQYDGGFSVGLRGVEQGLELVVCYKDGDMDRAIAWMRQRILPGCTLAEIEGMVLAEVSALVGSCIHRVYFSYGQVLDPVTDTYWLVPYD